MKIWTISSKDFVAGRISYEDHITQEIMNIYGFMGAGKFVKCIRCGKRLIKNYIGVPLNERMIEHAEIYHQNR